MRLALLLLSVAACAFHEGTPLVHGDGGAGGGDSSDASIDAFATGACVGTFVRVCTPTAPTLDVNFNAVTDIDTDACNSFLVRPQGAGAPELCVVYAHSILVGQTLTAHGARPLVLASTTTINIGGVVDVSSKRNGQRGAGANDPSCMKIDANGASGGAGGSHHGKGGNGGNANVDPATPAADAIATFSRVIGGCSGGDGAGGTGGDGGGAVMLIAGTNIMVGNAVLASGAGGHGGTLGGGGGGGTGGFIGFDSPVVHVSGKAIANGAGGAGGGAATSGMPGGDGTVDQTTALGGAGAPTCGGGGGGGSVNLMGQNGTGGVNSGGGGGGGAGMILMVGHAADLVGLYSPAPVVQ